jgi:uncharacterized protein (DUF1330 family)
MSVFMVMRVPGDPTQLERYAQSHADLMKKVAGEGQAQGAIHHSFAKGKNEIIVIDEWPSAEQFQSFFASQKDIPQIMKEGGAKGEPNITFYTKMDTPDNF